MVAPVVAVLGVKVDAVLTWSPETVLVQVNVYGPIPPEALAVSVVGGAPWQMELAPLTATNRAVAILASWVVDAFTGVPDTVWPNV